MRKQKQLDVHDKSYVCVSTVCPCDSFTIMRMLVLLELWSFENKSGCVATGAASSWNNISPTKLLVKFINLKNFHAFP